MPYSADPLLPLATQIVSAYVESHDVTADDMPGLIKDVYQALTEVGGIERDETRLAPSFSVRSFSASSPAPAAAPASSRRNGGGQTVFDDHLVCMDCGLHMKMLKRHLQTVHGLAPAQYRAKWHLPGDYPMVARQYADLRSNLAKESGLGKRPTLRGR